MPSHSGAVSSVDSLREEPACEGYLDNTSLYDVVY